MVLLIDRLMTEDMHDGCVTDVNLVFVKEERIVRPILLSTGEDALSSYDDTVRVDRSTTSDNEVVIEGFVL